MKDKADSEDVQAFWNSRAGLGQWAGTRDVIAKQVEIEVLASQARDGLNILEVGCGNGVTAIELARRYQVHITAIDFAAEMIKAAQELIADQILKGTVDFRVGDVHDIASFQQTFDLIYTERVLINLPDWPTQRQAILDITRLLKPGGLYAMCENSQDGLNIINELRLCLDLPIIQPPWHNRYFRDTELADLKIKDVILEGVDHYSSTYYFLSRVVNAALAAREGIEPDYNAPINLLALKLPPIGQCSQGRLWRWRSIKP